jgi:hypothetical protein
MDTKLDELFKTISRVFDILDLIVVRFTLLGLAVLGAYAVLNR